MATFRTTRRVPKVSRPSASTYSDRSTVAAAPVDSVAAPVGESPYWATRPPEVVRTQASTVNAVALVGTVAVVAARPAPVPSAVIAVSPGTAPAVPRLIPAPSVRLVVPAWSRAVVPEDSPSRQYWSGPSARTRLA